MTYAAEVGVGRTSLIWRTLTVICCEFPPGTGAILHLNCFNRLVPDFHLSFALKKGLKYVGFFVCKGKLTKRKHTQTPNRPALPSHTGTLFSRDTRAAGDVQNHTRLLWRCCDLSLFNEWNASDLSKAPKKLSSRFLPEESPSAACHKIKLLITHVRSQGIH